MSADNERFTLDTNLLVYAIDNEAGARHDAAGRIIRHAVRVDFRILCSRHPEGHRSTA
jgi:hypothetical protein